MTHPAMEGMTYEERCWHLEAQLAATERERDALLDAAGRVTCARCEGACKGWPSDEGCPDCGPLRKLMEELR